VSPGHLLAAYVGLIVYGSLVPFHYESLPWEEALDRFRALPLYHLGLASRSDLIANFLLYLPLGFLAMAAGGVGRARRAELVIAPLVGALGAALSVAVEFVQLWFPGRTTSLNDVYAESAGAGAGVLLWVAAGRPIIGWLRELRLTSGTRQLAARLLPAYLIGLVIIQAMPFDLTLSGRELAQKYREGRIVLVPFTGPAQGFELLRQTLWQVACFVPVGVLAAGRGQRGWLGAFALGLGTAAFIAVVQLFVYTRTTDPGDLLTGTLAVLLGWSAVRAYQRMQQAAASSRGQRDEIASVTGHSSRRRGLRLALLAVWLGLAVVISWQPFDLDASAEAVARKREELTLVPFADYYFGTDYNAFCQVLYKAAFFAPLGALLTPGRAQAGPAVGVLVVLTAMLLAAGLEAGQLLLPSHSVSISDVLVAGLGAGLGFALMRLAPAALGSTDAADGRQRERCR
jgi:glycopeptide antibiotics resistance protein